MKNKRAAHEDIIKKFQKKVAEIEKETEDSFVETVILNLFNAFLYFDDSSFLEFTRIHGYRH